MALPLTRMRGPGISPWSIASRTAESAEPAPSVPMSRSAVKPAIRSALAARVAAMTRCGTDSMTVCRSSAPGWRKRWCVGVDETGHEGRVSQVDRFRSRRMVDRRSSRHDLLPLDQNLSGGEDAALLNIEQASSVEYHRVRGHCAPAGKPKQRPSRRKIWRWRSSMARWLAG